MLSPVLRGDASEVRPVDLPKIEQDAETVLLATDGSAPAIGATQHAVLLARLLGARLKVISVDTGLEGLYVPEEPVSPERFALMDLAVQGMVVARRLAEVNGVRCTLEVLKGPVAGTIVGTAARDSASVIVLGDTGRTGLRRLAIGSVALAVVKASEIPVLVVKAK